MLQLEAMVNFSSLVQLLFQRLVFCWFYGSMTGFGAICICRIAAPRRLFQTKTSGCAEKETKKSWRNKLPNHRTQGQLLSSWSYWKTIVKSQGAVHETLHHDGFMLPSCLSKHRYCQAYKLCKTTTKQGQTVGV